MTSVLCRSCKEEKDPSDFYPSELRPSSDAPRGTGGPARRCKSCHNTQRTWHRYNKQLFDEAFEKQQGLCACCGCAKKLEWEHDHATGEFRGLVCHSCNSRIFHVERCGKTPTAEVQAYLS